MPLTCLGCCVPLRHIPTSDRTSRLVCVNRNCLQYGFTGVRAALNRPRPCATPLPARSTRRRRSGLRPGDARIRYNDGSRYTLSRVIACRRVGMGGTIEIVQALPERARVPGVLQHLIPGHNVDVVTWRRRSFPEELLDRHAHCPTCGSHDHTACPRVPWYRRLWAQQL